jgi:hypothetical protein
MTMLLLLSLMIVMMMMTMMLIAASAQGTTDQSRSGDRRVHDEHPPTHRRHGGFSQKSRRHAYLALSVRQVFGEGRIAWACPRIG